ncbi:MAG: zf-TFIIB domain-containing protein [Myxococcaceae bacterium]|nr:zf-TFIIB domain-containing protein [Myxococcaceae bacterium]
MPRKPHATEEEYFARQQALKREKLAKEEAARRAEEEREALKKLHWMRCPKCGQELKPFTTPIKQFQVERCESCQGMWFDSGELERLSEILSGPKSVSESFLSLFTPSKPTRSRKGDK